MAQGAERGAASQVRMDHYSEVRLEHHTSYFEPRQARQYWSVATGDDLFGYFRQFGDEVLESYKEFRNELITDKSISPGERMDLFVRHPMYEKFRKLHDLSMLITAFDVRLHKFPAGRMTWKAWVESQFPNGCDAGGGVFDDDSLFRCLPTPDWRDDRQLEFSNYRWEQGEKFRASWRATSCDEIASLGEIKKLPKALRNLWDDERCERIRRGATSDLAFP